MAPFSLKRLETTPEEARRIAPLRASFFAAWFERVEPQHTARLRIDVALIHLKRACTVPLDSARRAAMLPRLGAPGSSARTPGPGCSAHDVVFLLPNPLARASRSDGNFVHRVEGRPRDRGAGRVPEAGASTRPHHRG